MYIHEIRFRYEIKQVQTTIAVRTVRKVLYPQSAWGSGDAGVPGVPRGLGVP